MKKHNNLLVVLFLFCFSVRSQEPDSVVIRKIYDHELTQGRSYSNLRSLCKDIGHRLSGSKNAEKAVEWAKKRLEEMGADTVYLQPVMVPHWVRGDKEYAEIKFSGFTKPVDITALGGSIGTGKTGITAKVIKVNGLEDLEKLGRDKVEGKIVFYSRPMNPKFIQTFYAYGACVDQRYAGASEASKYGAVAAIVRSMSHKLDHLPHTGQQQYTEGVGPIPTAAISTAGAELLIKALSEDANTTFQIKMNCQILPDVQSYNVIGEIRGTEYPDEIILVGGHLDSWDMGEGAHDDGAGVVHSMEVINLFSKLEMKPKRTIRCVLFMNEENGLRGAKEYARVAEKIGECHMAAIESDGGGFAPRGFTIAGEEDVQDNCYNKILEWKHLFEPYLVHYFEKGWGGADIGRLKNQGTALIGFVPESQRYFDHHHADSDVFEAVNKRELELGSATITSLIYLLSEYGLGSQSFCQN